MVENLTRNMQILRYHLFAFTAQRGKKHLSQCHKYKKLQLEPVRSTPTIEQYAKPISSPQQEALQLAFARWVYCDGRPLKLFDSKPAIDAFRAFLPSFKPPTSKQLKHLPLNGYIRRIQGESEGTVGSS